MTDAVLSFVVKSDQAKQAAADLDKLEQSAKKAERAAVDWGNKTEVASQKVSKGAAATAQFEKALDGMVSQGERASDTFDMSGTVIHEFTKGLTRAIGPAALAGAAFMAAGVTAQAAFRLIFPEIKAVDDIVRDHEQHIRMLGPAYAEARQKAQEYANIGPDIADILFGKDKRNADKRLAAAFNEAVVGIRVALASEATRGTSLLEPFRGVIEQYAKGVINVREFNTEVAQFAKANPAFKAGAEFLSDITIKALEAEIALFGVSEKTDRVSHSFSEVQKAINAINPYGVTGKLSEVEKKAKELFNQARAGQIDIHDLNREMRALSDANLDMSAQIEEIRRLEEQAIRTRMAIEGLANTTPKSDRLGRPDALGDMEFYKRFNAGWDKDLVDGLTPKPTKGQGRLASEKVSDYEREITQIQKRTASLEAEARVVGLSTFASEKYLATQKLEAAARKDGIGLTEERIRAIDKELTAYARQVAAIEASEKAQRQAEESMRFMRDTTKGFIDDLSQGLQNGEGFWRSFGNAALGVLDQIVDKLLNDVLDAIFQVNNAGAGGGGFLSGLLGMLGGGLGGGAAGADPWAGLRMAKGGAFENGISGFSNTVVNRATPFMFAKGAGIMGEAGPEAIMPLKRDSSGRLGVSAANTNQRQPANDGIQADIRVFFDENGNLDAKIERISQKSGKQLLAQYDKGSAYRTSRDLGEVSQRGYAR